MEALRQPCPIVRLHKYRDVRLLQRLSQNRQLVAGYPLQIRPSEHQVQITALVPSAVDAAAVSPHLHAGHMLAQQGLDSDPGSGAASPDAQSSDLSVLQ